MKRNIRISMMLFSILFLLIASISISYSYFVAQGVKDESGSTIEAHGATLTITYESADIIFKEKLYPREEEWATKTFTVTGNNTSPLKMNYYVGMDVEASDFPDGALTYTLSGSKTDTGSTLVPAVTAGTIPNGKSKVYFGVGQFINGYAIHTYTLKIFYPDTEENQNNEQGSSYKAKLFIEEAGTGEIVDKRLDRIELTTNPTKTKYIKGENFDPTGMVITAYYTDGTHQTVTNYELIDNVNLQTNQNVVRLSYTEDLITRTIAIPIRVTNDLIKLDIITPPTKTTYVAGEDFDASNMVVQATFEDGSLMEVNNYTLANNYNLVKGQTYVTVQYTHDGITKSVKQTITVTNKVTGIMVSVPPTKTMYVPGQTFDSTGMVVSAIYENGASQAITGYTITDGTIAEGQSNVTISYKDPETNKVFTTTQKIKIGSGIESLEITTPPTKTIYAVGSAFDPTGMVVKVRYSNGKSKVITNYTIVNGSSLTADQTSVTISYTELGETVTTTQAITIDTTGPTVTLQNSVTRSSQAVSDWAKRFEVYGSVNDVSGVESIYYCSTTSTTCTPTTKYSSTSEYSLTLSDTSTTTRYCVQAVDKLGNKSAIKCSDAYKVDSTAPTVSSSVSSSTQNAAKTWYKSISLQVNATDNIQYIKYCLTTSASCTPSTTYSSAVSLSDGSSSKICYQATDNAGNKSSISCSSGYNVDGTAPTVTKATPTTISGSNGWYKAVTTKFSLSETNSGIASLKYCTTTSSTCTPSTAYSVTSGTTTLTSFTQSIINTSTAKRVCIQVTDVADNASGVVCSDSYKVDNTVPTLKGTATLGTSGNGWYASAKYKYTISDTYSGLASAKYCKTTSTSCTPSTSYTSATNISLANATRLCVNATDNAGNTSDTKCSSTYKVDSTAPTASSLTKSGSTLSSTGTDSQSGVYASCLSTSKTDCSSGVWVVASSVTSSYKASYTISSAGTYYIHFKDSVGNIKYNTNSATYSCSTTLHSATSIQSRYFANGSVSRGWVSGTGTNNYVFAGYNTNNYNNYVGQVQYSISSVACYWKIKFTLAGTDNTNANKNIALMLDPENDSKYYNLKGTYGSTHKQWQHASFRIDSSSYGYNGCEKNTVCFNKIINSEIGYGYLYHNSNGTSYDNAMSYSSLYVGGAGGSYIQYGILS
ncbi:bacterial Ig-like domain-containing protein [bacterium]|nr:bacterial Ig-like domain-containing protein [bacterium]